MPGLDENIRTSLAELVATGSGSDRIYPWNVLSHNLGEWPGLFRGAGGVHGWVIKRVDLPSERKNAQRDRRVFEYDIWGFYSFRSGKTGDNSDIEINQICDDVYDEIKGSPRLGFENDVEYHGLLQFRGLTTIDCGEETLHFCPGRLSVHLCC